MLFGTSGLVAFLLLGNLLIAGAWVWAREAHPPPAPQSVEGVGNIAAVDAHVWRGAAPSERGYEELAAHGVDTIVDLRAEDDIDPPLELMNRLDMNLVRIPLRDGQAPTPDEVQRFLDVVREARGRVFVHCGAGVGRTGTMAAAYLVKTGQASGLEALRRNLSVGPPSLEQIAFAADLSGDDVAQPNTILTAVSRVLDGPRRLWVRISD
ncbi:MAG: fused DSP-PTPase phosphatase/NAD kinase-like protein [Actinomycetota bacterium]